MISEAILIPKINARLQEIASNFSKKILGRPLDPPPALAFCSARFGALPLTGPPFPKFLNPLLEFGDTWGRGWERVGGGAADFAAESLVVYTDFVCTWPWWHKHCCKPRIKCRKFLLFL